MYVHALSMFVFVGFGYVHALSMFVFIGLGYNFYFTAGCFALTLSFDHVCPTLSMCLLSHAPACLHGHRTCSMFYFIYMQAGEHLIVALEVWQCILCGLLRLSCSHDV